jgi:F-type H+-transporting ATPase subunit b
MTIDFWGLGLQAVNVLVLVWLLSRIFWRPVSAAITQRQEMAAEMIATAKSTQDKADAHLAEATQARAGISLERTKALSVARTEAEAATQAILAEAQAKAEAMLADAKTTIEQNAEAARAANAKDATELALTIAAELLSRMVSPALQAEFLSRLIKAIEGLPPRDRVALLEDPGEIEIVTATDLMSETADLRDRISAAIHTALGAKPALRFVTDPDLISGIELHGSHLVVHNSWRADLVAIRKAVRNAA